MNLSTVANNLRKTIAGKEELLKKALSAYNDIKSVEKSFGREGMVSHALSASTQYLEVNIDELKRILQDVEQCLPDEFANMRNEASWITNPDRSGGQFTQDEIDNSGRWQ